MSLQADRDGKRKMGKKISILSRGLGQNLKNEYAYYRNLVIDDSDMFRNELARLTESLDLAGQKIDVLDVFAHGMFVVRPNVTYAVLDSQLVGAYGVKMGNDYLTSRTVDMVDILNGYFAPGGIINFHVCALAAQNADWTGKKGVYSGDGVKLCSTISQKANCLVRASTSLQKYQYQTSLVGALAELLMGDGDSSNYDLEFLDWSPPTYIFDQKGRKTKES